MVPASFHWHIGQRVFPPFDSPIACPFKPSGQTEISYGLLLLRKLLIPISRLKLWGGEGLKKLLTHQALASLAQARHGAVACLMGQAQVTGEALLRAE